MLDDLMLSPDVSFYIGALVQWGGVMALVLIINKDILGLVKLKNVVLNRKTPVAR